MKKLFALNPQPSTINHLRFAFFSAFSGLLLAFNSAAQLPTNNITPSSVTVTTDTSGHLLAPPTFFNANSNALNAAIGPVRSSTNLLTTATTNAPGALIVNTTNISGGITNTNTALTFNGGSLTNLILGVPLIPPGAVYTNNAALGGPSYQVTVGSGQRVVGVITNINSNMILDAEGNPSSLVQSDASGIPTYSPLASIIYTPDTTLYAYNEDGSLLGQPVQEQIYAITTNAGYYLGDFAGRFKGEIADGSLMPTNVLLNYTGQTVTWNGGQWIFKANRPGNADNVDDDGIVIWQANSNLWSTVKFLDNFGIQQGAIGYGNTNAGFGSVSGHPTETYYNNIMFWEAPGIYFVHSGKIIGGWVYNTAYDATGSLVMFYHSGGVGNDGLSDNITNNMTNVCFRVDPTTANTYVGTNGHGSLVLGLAPTLQKTNTAPTSVTLGTTAPDLWFPVTNNGTVFMLPAWKNH